MKLSATVDWDELARLMEMPSSAAFDPRTVATIRQVGRWAGRFARPWRGSWRFSPGQVALPPSFQRKLATARSPVLIVLAATAGAAFDRRSERLWQRGRYDEAYIVRTYGAALAESLREQFARELRHWAEANQFAIVARGSPGCGAWPLETIHDLFRLIAGQPDFTPRLQLHESGMLQPLNSVLTVFAVAQCDHAQSRRLDWPCQECGLAGCRFRRKPAKILSHEVKN